MSNTLFHGGWLMALDSCMAYLYPYLTLRKHHMAEKNNK
jgi:hypothetical protein